MSESVTLARPYAEAAFRLAQEEKVVPQWSQALEKWACCAADPRLQACLADPALTPPQKAQLLASLIGDAISAAQTRFLQLLADNGRLGLLADIAQGFEKLKAQADGVRDALIQSAFALDATQTSALLPSLEKRFGGQLKPRVQICPDLIGGLRVQVGDHVYDASVRGKLDALAQHLRAP
jgi:F-type H+-transporting ATPase subunit delta